MNRIRLHLSTTKITKNGHFNLRQNESIRCSITSDSFYDPMDCSPPGSSVHEDPPGKNTEVGCHAVLQGIFPTQGSNPGLPYCRRILLSESPGMPKNTGVCSLSLLQGNFPTQELKHSLLNCRWILYQLSHQGSPI